MAYNPTDPPSPLEELTSEEFPTYFIEREERLFHSHPTSPYPMPVDTPDSERINAQHKALFELLGSNYIGPVPNVLADVPGRQRLVLDLCTGTGKWLMDMAAEFPHVLFAGIDIVPIATRYPLPNAQFEMHDVNERTRWPDNSIDLVHARSVSMSVQHYPTMLTEVLRILRPGGLFLSAEWGRYPAFHPSFDLDPAEHAPALCRFFGAMNSALAHRGIFPVASMVPSWLNSTGRFIDITPRVYYFPIGSWHIDPLLKRVGNVLQSILLRFSESARVFLLDSGLVEAQVDAMHSDLEHELHSIEGLVAVFHTVHATKY